MQLRTVLFCSFLAVPALAACGDDSGGGSGGDGSTSGSSTTTGTTTGSSTSGSTSGSPASSGSGEGGSGEGGDSSSSTSTSSAGGGDPALSCETYCSTIATACEDNLQYPDEASCLAACATFPDGTYADAEATLGCHQYHADAAVADPGVHCGHAGPMGDSQCAADPCDNFCEIAPVICPDVYSSAEVCSKVCVNFEIGEFSVDPPATGDTLGCRMYHLTVAAQSEGNAAIHCAHIAADSSQCN